MSQKPLENKQIHILCGERLFDPPPHVWDAARQIIGGDTGTLENPRENEGLNIGAQDYSIEGPQHRRAGYVPVNGFQNITKNHYKTSKI